MNLTCGQNGLNALVNNAGCNYNLALEWTEKDKARAMMEVNFFGTSQNESKIYSFASKVFFEQ